MKSVIEKRYNRSRATLVYCAALALASTACGSSGGDDAADTTVTGTGGAAPGTGGAPSSGAGGNTVATGGVTAPTTGGVSGAAGMTAAGTGGKPDDVGGTGGGPAVVPTGSTDWAFIGYDLGSTYFNTGETVLTKETAASLTEIWTKDLGGQILGAPLQVGDTIYANGPNTINAYNAMTGAELWSKPASSTGSMGFADGKLFLHLGSGDVASYDAATGEQLWSKNPEATQSNDGSSSVVVSGDTLLVGGANGGLELSTGAFRGYLSAMSAMTGDVLWTQFTVMDPSKGASIWSTPSIDAEAGRGYAGTGNNYGSPTSDTSDSFIAFDLKTGAIAWKAQKVESDGFSLAGGGPDADFGANPVLYEAMVGGTMTKLVGGGNKGGDAHAVRRDDGSKVWSRDLGPGAADGSQGIFVNSTWTGKDLLVACNEAGTATLYALDGGTGDITWMRKLQGPVWGRISAVRGVGFVGVGATLEVIDLDTGDVIKSFPSKGGTVAGTITISNGRVAYGEGFGWSSGTPGSTLHVLAVQ